MVKKEKDISDQQIRDLVRPFKIRTHKNKVFYFYEMKDGLLSIEFEGNLYRPSFFYGAQKDKIRGWV